MTILQAIFLGIVQGLTEFLPISSSGHLTIMQYVLGIPPDIPFDITVHLATLLAVVIYFWSDIIELFKGFFLGLVQLFKKDKNGLAANLYFRFSLLIIVATIPTALMGLFFKDFFEGLFSSLFAVGGFLLVTGLIIILAERVKRGDKDLGKISFVDALIVGAAQGCAIAPGLSRSGTTISAALFRGLNRKLAARFSFIVALPAIFGAFLLQFKGVVGQGSSNGGAWPWFWVL